MSAFRYMSTAARAAGSPATRLRHLLILDFEATCGDPPGPVVPRNEMEIIELPTLLYDIEQDQVKATFHEYVRPVRHPTLTKFCTDLTGIEQSTVDAADTFHTVWERYQEFLREHGAIQDPESRHQVGLDPSTGALAPPYNRWINVKKSFQRLHGLKNPRGMAGMLRHANMELEGRHHSGIDDCKNILRVVQRMRQDGWKPSDDLP
ncbi:exonuclease [Lentinus brumalis]|uniref:Exonuclease n=1 Tax=Lentinus brumalis TaxID=2498619 RepID=A0A371DHP9_9APHY|nr:exonuclease [Polyporus brumalis]